MTNENRAKLTEWKKQQAEKAHAQVQSEISQRRILRRLGKIDESTLRWEAMARLRAGIEKEIRPRLEALKKARKDILWIDYELPVRKPKKAVRSYLTAADLPTDPEMTPEWWEAAMLRERELRKLGLLVD